jgi:hypothetical protein
MLKSQKHLRAMLAGLFLRHVLLLWQEEKIIFTLLFILLAKGSGVIDLGFWSSGVWHMPSAPNWWVVIFRVVPFWDCLSQSPHH